MQQTNFLVSCNAHLARIFELRSKTFFSLLITLLLLFFFPMEAEGNKSKLISIQHWQTSKGVEVYFVKITNLPILDIRLIFTAGSAYDGKQEGVALVTGCLLNEGAGGQRADKIANLFDKIGAIYQVNVDRDKTTLSLRTLTGLNYLNQALTEFILLFSQPSFSPDSLQRIKGQVISEIKSNKQQPGKLADNTFYHELYGSQPYAHDPIGKIETVGRLTQKDCKRFHSKYYVAQNANIILVGDVSLQSAKKISQRISDKLPLGTPALPLKTSQPITHPVLLHIPFPSQQTSIVIGQLGIAPNDPDYFPLLVGNYAFGGLPLESELFLKIRDQKGLSYYAGSYFTLLKYRGPFKILIKTRAEKTEETLFFSREAFERFIEKGLSKQQLEYAKENLIGGFPMLLSSNEKIAAIVSDIAFYQRPLNYLNTYVKNISKVSVNQVKQAFQHLIDLRKILVITVGPGTKNNDKKKERNT